MAFKKICEAFEVNICSETTVFQNIFQFKRDHNHMQPPQIYQSNVSVELESNNLLSCQPRVTVTSCFVYKIIRDLEPIDHLSAGED